ncbi:RNA-splicing ligase RtcB [Butyrivibrio fibrisolvens]|uniref:3'-phosphate/5'-hydroxy nucleic acid ligase n=2 Tax=Butyrivibrio fibrisolvens TaxID=831 RepID=A0A317G7A5_BUTFI|nr:RNA-splicing ligase RtcB [Butyrivibrio fibrisolvens]
MTSNAIQRCFWDAQNAIGGFILIQIIGKYANARIMCIGETPGENIEQYALSQIQMIADNEASKGSNICVMPDVHPGKVGPIGLTMTITDAVNPSLVGIDIGCGMSMVKLGRIRKEYQKLDAVIGDKIPAGFKIRDTAHDMAKQFDFERLICTRHIRKDKALLSLGTLGGGNHFIEIDVDENGDSYLIVHSGSRHLGKEVAEYYSKLAYQHLRKMGRDDVPIELSFLTGDNLSDYLHDVSIVQEYAQLNRRIMIKEICKAMKWKPVEEKSCIHNYIDNSHGEVILRKGAISARDNEDVIIPINMKDGVILGKGKGNKEWNYSAPHGAGRISSRKEVLESHTVSEFKATMKGIYSTCISKETLDEAPFAYRNIDYIKEAVKDSVDITNILTPVYNYKGGDER